MADETPEVLRDRAQEILSDPRYAGDQPGLVDRAFDRLGQLISDLLSVVTGGTSFGGVLVGLIFLGLMVGLVVFFIVRYLPRVQPVTSERVRAVVQTTRNRKSRKEWLAEASEAESRGHYREAVRARYWATVAGLIENEEVPDTPGTTVNELRAQFEAEAARKDPFNDASDSFSDIWYGGFDADPTDSAQLATWDERVVGGKRGGG
ncbi:MAG: DUF4129 domain-containing protein [Acidimicrobiales bacterium]|nr:DUF4129 domain-containing protein [Acidimicrobiales bacterium]